MNELQIIHNENEVDDTGLSVLNFTSNSQVFSSCNPQTFEEKMAYFNAINSPQHSMKEFINKTIKLKDVFAETCEFINRETGEASPGVRIVFIDDKGVSYKCAAKGIFSSLKKLFAVVGMPNTWEKPIPIEFKEVAAGTNRVLVFNIVSGK